VHDAARAIQFIRHKANEWNIDTKHIALTGVSAGALHVEWLLLHDDRPNQKAADPVLRRIDASLCRAVLSCPVCIDPKVIEGWVGPNVLQHYVYQPCRRRTENRRCSQKLRQTLRIVR